MRAITDESEVIINLRKQPKFRVATTGFSEIRRLSNGRRNSILMTRRYPDLGSASDWLKQIFSQSGAN